MIRLILVCVLFPLALPAQRHLGKTTGQVKKQLQQYFKSNDIKEFTLAETDSTLLYSLLPGKRQPATFIYGFGRDGRCRSEKVIAGCDSCFNKLLNGVLQQSRFGWRKINENQYVSKYEVRMMLEIPPENKDYSYTIFKTYWNRASYALLIQ